ncbi:hypothetical protein [uncultured Roseobacter sp.]|uniref:spike base protein, RCAP_Rcc01079 family n=1 Tax=uncultured Roseobacter sp. TaxID=114847 RepID=UPI002614E210|nr:hypothetical protein [uncultured Roseobacter sp.]
MTDNFRDFTGGLESPATHLVETSPSDTGDLPMTSRALNVGTAGTLRVTTIGGTTATVYIAAGIPFPVRVTRIWQTGTTATGIVVMY